MRALVAVLALLVPAVAPALPLGAPSVSIDLATSEGARLLDAQWRTAPARLVEVDFRSPGPDRKPTGSPSRTWDVEPKAGGAGFDDSSWPAIEPESLDERRSGGRVCFQWYRTTLTVPERFGDVPSAGATLVFETVVDDYAEVWVDGQLPRALGQSGGSLVAGWNAPNRLVVAEKARPGQRIEIAIFGINGPISDPPANYVWMRSVRLDAYVGPHAVEPEPVEVTVERRDPELDAIVPADLLLERVATGFLFTEGPAWTPEGTLLFSDPNANTIYEWTPSGELSAFRSPSGYAGADVALYGQPGSNGLAFDPEGRLTICEHGNHRISRLEADGTLTVLADGLDGRRLNSPNDLAWRSDGALFFTDPPFGLPAFHDDPRRELPFEGVYSLVRGRLAVVSKDLAGPNGIAFSPDERFLYVANWDPARKVVMRYEAAADGTLSRGRVFFDMTDAPGEEALDGIEVDRDGHLYVSGPGGLWILSADGRHLGTVRGPELAANFEWGGEDGRTLFLTARTGVYRMRLLVPGRTP
jgi:gluconolactonase